MPCSVWGDSSYDGLPGSSLLIRYSASLALRASARSPGKAQGPLGPTGLAGNLSAKHWDLRAQRWAPGPASVSLAMAQSAYNESCHC